MFGKRKTINMKTIYTETIYMETIYVEARKREGEPKREKDGAVDGSRIQTFLTARDKKSSIARSIWLSTPQSVNNREYNLSAEN